MVLEGPLRTAQAVVLCTDTDCCWAAAAATLLAAASISMCDCPGCPLAAAAAAAAAAARARLPPAPPALPPPLEEPELPADPVLNRLAGQPYLLLLRCRSMSHLKVKM